MYVELSKVELDENEREVLLGLVIHLVDADEERSIEEIEGLKEIGNAIGRDVFVVAAREARRRFGSHSNLKAGAETVRRPEARAAIFAALRDLSMRDGLVAEEYELLGWLSSTWGIDWSSETADT